MTKKVQPQTFHSGANAERSAILAKVRRMIESIYGGKRPKHSQAAFTMLEHFEAWLLKRNERYDVKSGGLGRK